MPMTFIHFTPHERKPLRFSVRRPPHKSILKFGPTTGHTGGSYVTGASYFPRFMVKKGSGGYTEAIKLERLE
jgi:hypothetical protein